MKMDKKRSAYTSTGQFDRLDSLVKKKIAVIGNSYLLARNGRL